MYYCTKTTYSGSSDSWPKGNYCFARKCGSCPSGFCTGFIYWDDEDTSNRNCKYGVLPDGQYDRNTKINYCCRNHDCLQCTCKNVRYKSNEIVLMASQKPADSCNDSCSICNDKFVYQVKRKRFDRTSIDSKLHRQPEKVSDVLEHLIQLTPNRDEKAYICSSCSSKVFKYGQLLYSKEELRTVADSSTYIGKKY
ncbi:unnamed protein product [Mytilus edulis]|uniref:Apextrin C-terminal domain-containing protein n=1 Tax=Mytilus edulis TaxID=6550 RepID=A0A8S3S6U3_MYTED|nr:unnamed protein product [Mytilus edulis]